jgi:pimeloyl-ACP methyl ester carboxylesterase
MIASKQRSQNYIFIFTGIALIFAMSGALNMRSNEHLRGETNLGRNNMSGILSLLFQPPQGTLHQYKADGITEFPKGGALVAGSVALGISFSSNTGLTPLRLQVEIRPLGVAFTGNPTAVSGVLVLTKSGTVAVSGLASGSYHWQARVVNTLTGAAAVWQSFGGVASGASVADFIIVLREPVLIVPGIAGTILQRTSDATEVWPNVDKMLVSPSDSYLDALALNPMGDASFGGAQSTIRAVAILQTATLTAAGITLFSDDFYGNLINALKGDGYMENQNLFTVPYDWRLDINKSAATLAAKIAQAVAASPTGKIAIIAHSMGGLLVKKYLASLASAPFLDKVVLVGVPELGAPYAFKILNYGDNLGIPIANQDEIKKIAQNMPAIYELLPSKKYTASVGGYVQDFRSGSGAVGAAAANNALANLADALHQSVDNVPSAGTSPNVYTIMGCGKPTITGYDLYDNGVVDLERGSGDGTVPDASAMAMETGTSHNYFVLSGVTGIDHTGLMSDARPVALIKNIIDGGAMLMLPQGISTNAADCATQSFSGSSANETTIEFSAYGAADLGVYDAAGNYTGVTASGTVAIGIPGSDYEKLGDNTFILVPAAASTYKVESRTGVAGLFAMKVRGYRGVAIDREVTYQAMPTSTTAELDFAGFGGNMDLHVKRTSGGAGVGAGSAGGQTQGVHHPDSVFTGPFTRDRRRIEWSPPH